VADGVLSLDTLNDSKRRLDGLQAWLKKPAGLQGEIPKLETETSAPAQAKAEDDMSTQPAGEEKPAADEAAAEETGPKPAEAAVEAPKTVEEAAAVKPEEPEPAEAVAETAPEAPKPAAEAPQPAAATDKPVYHLVKPGDTLTRLSLRYNVSIEDLKAWNDLDDEKILLDTKLRVSPPGN
jgi:LysM repeat protein